ncbi:LysE family translocator [Fulvivirga sp. M361]|uniref:LysE family translocator n=1 Tax=Fulvivirga sp. M361 TaxID=2594266 RepID=UPI00117AE608|nr:LysE family transporter [Fulvivirga sp. M361]TRX49844.1 LysE family translocator [Fulvivirga sp. M361]
MYVIHGLLLGLVLMLLIGPVFFTLIQTSIEKGFKKAVLVAVGISLSDILYITVGYLGLATFVQQSGYDEYIAYVGGTILILFGCYNFIKKPQINPQQASKSEIKGFFRFIFQGFFINGMSPFVLVFWLGALSLATVEYSYSGYELIVFFLATTVMVFISDCGKAYLANKLRKLVTTRFMRIINILAGIALILFGFRMLFYS